MIENTREMVYYNGRKDVMPMDDSKNMIGSNADSDAGLKIKENSMMSSDNNPKHSDVDEPESDNEDIESLRKTVAKLQAKVQSLSSARGSVNRQAKSSVFTDLFSRKEYLIQLYRQLHPEDVNITVDDLEIITISTVLTNGPHNDLGFTARGKLMVLGEAQSIWSPNIIFRLWEYGGESLMDFALLHGQNVYGTSKIDLPDFEAFVIYTGNGNMCHVQTDSNGIQYISLNETFFGSRKDRPELIARVIHVDNATGILQEYYRFCKIFDKCVDEHKDDKEAILRALFDECKKEKVLTKYLDEHRTEVERIMSGLLTQELVDEMAERSERIKDAVIFARALGISDDQIKNQLVIQYDITPGYADNILATDFDNIPSGPMLV